MSSKYWIQHIGYQETAMVWPAHEVIFGPLVLVPDGDLQLGALVVEDGEVELFKPSRVKGLVNGLRFVAFVAESEMTSVCLQVVS